MDKILNEASPLWGVCSFDCLKDRLIDCRALSRIPKGASSVIVFAFPYRLPDEMYEGLNVSKYAVSCDYHGVLSARLGKCVEELKSIYPDEEFVWFADNSPIPEAEAACRAGIGVRGLNSMIITERFGSFVFIGEIVTTLYLKPAEVVSPVCRGCGACVRKCPTGAISESGVDREKCLSAVTQKKSGLTEEEAELIEKSGCAWGCDVCQNVCPMNIEAEISPLEEFVVSAMPHVTETTEIEGRAFAWRGEKVIRRNIDIITRKGKKDEG